METKTMYIELNNVNKKIKKKEVLKDISVNIRSGQICGLTGDNGSGKSMLLKAISGLIEIDSGTISVCDKTVGHGNLAENTGILIETPGLLLSQTAYQNLKMLCIKRNYEQHICFTLSSLGLNPYDKRPTKKYSLGMKQKVGIAQALFERPKLLLLDEPTSNLDEESTLKVLELLKAMNEEYGTTIIISSHQKENINSICSRVFKMIDGTIAEL